MHDTKALQKKITELEIRVKELENELADATDPEEKAWMDALYEKAKRLVIEHRKAGIFFIGRKLLIDERRVEHILRKLEQNGVVGPARGIEPRHVLMKDA
jgi:S-DNA-T family DNA segregation ATPase FtsK/SpoIIIE